MINLSDRLEKMAQSINKGETMADIGTDHGFLPLYMLQNAMCPRVIMTDISEKSLMKAEENAVIYLGEQTDAAEFRVGDGLVPLGKSEVDTIVIAGMGGKLIRDIMAEDMELTMSFKKYILQPRIGQGELRRWLIENGFVIISDDLVREGRHIPEIITVLTPLGAVNGSEPVKGMSVDSIRQAEKSAGNIVYRIPPWITDADGPVMDFLDGHIESSKVKLESVMLAKERNCSLEEEICREIRYLECLLKEVGSGRNRESEK